MGPIVQRRLDTDWEKEGGKPNDMIQVLIDAAPPIERTMPQIVERMMTLNMASIHTTTMTLTSAVYTLAAQPDEYVPVLRNEVLSHSIDGKIDKQALGKLTKLDSFLRECGRVTPLGLLSSARLARKDFTFSDGMVIPAGSMIAAPIPLFHRDEAPGEANGDVFDGLRYAKLNEQSAGPTKHQMVNTELDYLLFGHGKHACPGRFLAVTELKLILATLLLQYDLKLIPGTAPKDFYFGTARVPEMKLPVLMKARMSDKADMQS
jgi:cytochrome P450